MQPERATDSGHGVVMRKGLPILVILVGLAVLPARLGTVPVGQGATAVAEALRPDMTVAMISIGGGHQPGELKSTEIQLLVNRWNELEDSV